MDFVAFAAALTIMAAIIVGLLAVYQSTAQPRGDLDRRLGHLMSEATSFELAAAEYQALRPKREGSVPIIGALLEGKKWTEEMALRLERADIKLTVSEFVGLRVFFALMSAAVPLLILGTTLPFILLACICGFVGYAAPSFYVNMAKGKREKKIVGQLVEALSLISNSLKAGFGLMQSLDLAARELEHPIATEFRHTLHDINIGMSTEDALVGLAKRSGSDDFDIVITAMLIQQSTGGNLAEILDNVGHTMRERIRIRGEIKTLTSQQMLTGFIIGGLPIFMVIAFMLINPNYMTPLFTQVAGRVMLIGAGMLEMFGIFLIKRILAIEV